MKRNLTVFPLNRKEKKMSEKRFVMMVGLPASKKTVVAEEICKRLQYAYVSIEDIKREQRKEEGPLSKKQITEESAAEESAQSIVKLLNNLEVKGCVYDATNLSRKEREVLLSKIKEKKDVIIDAVLMAVPFEECLMESTRRSFIRRENRISSSKMMEILTRFQCPQLYEGFTEIYVMAMIPNYWNPIYVVRGTVCQSNSVLEHTLEDIACSMEGKIRSTAAIHSTARDQQLINQVESTYIQKSFSNTSWNNMLTVRDVETILLSRLHRMENLSTDMIQNLDNVIQSLYLGVCYTGKVLSKKTKLYHVSSYKKLYYMFFEEMNKPNGVNRCLVISDLIGRVGENGDYPEEIKESLDVLNSIYFNKIEIETEEDSGKEEEDQNYQMKL